MSLERKKPGPKPRPLPTVDEIFARCIPIPESGCWVWLGPDNGKAGWLAHGKLWFAGKVRYVHRVMWFLSHGHWPTQHIHHRCDVRMCCNPDHLADVLPIVNYQLGRGPEYQYKPLRAYDTDPFELVDA